CVCLCVFLVCLSVLDVYAYIYDTDLTSLTCTPVKSLVLSAPYTDFHHFSGLAYVTLNFTNLTKSHRFSLPIAQNNKYKSNRLLSSASERLPCSCCVAHYVCVA